MSVQSTGLNNANALIMNQDVSKIFLRNNRFQDGQQVNNSSYDPWELPAGTLMGRNSVTGKLQVLDIGTTDGSQFPVGVLAHDVSIEPGETVDVTICDGGDVAEDKVDLYHNGQSLDSVVSSRRLRDHLQAQGIKLISATEMTQYDNQ